MPEKTVNDWRRARIQLINHILESHTWGDIMLGIDALFKVSLHAKSLIEEEKLFSEEKGKTCENIQQRNED